MIKKFYETLFEPEERTCFSSDCYSTFLHDITPFSFGRSFFVINPMRFSRADDNVTSFRNILVEFDEGTIESQYEHLTNSGVPYSTLVFSGGKSLHAIISLEWPFTNKEEYKKFAKAIYAKIGNVDTANSNPSRFSRAPGAMRDNGKEQTLLEVHERVPLAELLQWLGPIVTNSVTNEANKVQFENKGRLLTATANAFLKYGAPDKQWNTRLFMASCDIFRAGYTLEEAELMLAKVTGHLDSKDRSTIKSAQRTINRDS